MRRASFQIHNVLLVAFLLGAGIGTRPVLADLYVSVDDFESYDDADKAISQTWVDNGLVVGNDSPPYAERVIVHGGKQSMPLFYDKGLSSPYSETYRIFSSPQDWTGHLWHGLDTLTLYVYGSSNNDPGPLYVGVEDRAGKTSFATYSDNTILTSESWTKWDISLSQFTGVDLAKVWGVYIGFGIRGSLGDGSAGQFYVDDIRLTRAVAPVPIPGAALLGALGLSVAGWRLRRNQL